MRLSRRVPLGQLEVGVTSKWRAIVSPTQIPEISHRPKPRLRRADLILLADLSNVPILRSHPRVTERAINRTGLHGHASTHDPMLWAQSGLTDEVRDKWLPALTAR